MECVCRIKENKENTFRNELFTDFYTDTCTLQTLREKRNENDQSFNSPFKSRESLSVIQEGDIETDTKMDPIDNYFLELEMSVEAKLVARNLFNDIDLICPVNSAVEITSDPKLQSKFSSDNLITRPDKQSVLITDDENEIKDLLLINKLSSNSAVNTTSFEFIADDSFLNVTPLTKIKSRRN